MILSDFESSGNVINNRFFQVLFQVGRCSLLHDSLFSEISSCAHTGLCGMVFRDLLSLLSIDTTEES